MATTRKDLRGRTLRKGEMQRSSDKRYAYSYTDQLGRRKYIYANDLVTLREKEAQLTKDQMDGLDIYVAGKATVNFVFDRYMSLKTNLRQTTRSNDLYMYDRFIRDTFGKKKIAEIRYSDVLQFYNYLLDKQGLQTNTLESVHTLLHPTFQLAVRDEIVRKNPTDGVMAEIKKSSEQTTGVRHALTIPQQRAFMEHIANHPVGNFSGAASTIAVAAVGANSFVISLVVNFFIGIALGANVVIANAIGREDEDDVHRAVHTAVVVSVLGGVLVTIFGELAAGTVLRSLNVLEEVLPYALLYLRIYLLGMPVILLYNFEAAIFRSIGDTRVPLQTLAFSGILNVLLNLFFVIVLHMTVNGVATATVISNAISSVLLFVRLRRSDKAIHLEWKELRIDRKSLQKILQIGFPAGIQSAVFSVSDIVI